MPAKRFCLRGHDTQACGRIPSTNQCRACRRAERRRPEGRAKNAEHKRQQRLRDRLAGKLPAPDPTGPERKRRWRRRVARIQAASIERARATWNDLATSRHLGNSPPLRPPVDDSWAAYPTATFFT